MYYKQCIEFKGFCCSRTKHATCDEIFGSPTILRTKVVLKDCYKFLNVLTSQIMLLHEVMLLQQKMEVVLCCHGILKEDESVVSVQVLLVAPGYCTGYIGPPTLAPSLSPGFHDRSSFSSSFVHRQQVPLRHDSLQPHIYICHWCWYPHSLFNFPNLPNDELKKQYETRGKTLSCSGQSDLDWMNWHRSLRIPLICQNLRWPPLNFSISYRRRHKVKSIEICG